MTDRSEVLADFDVEGVRAVVLYVRGSHYCGYVGVGRLHPWWGHGYDRLSELYGDEEDGYRSIPVHGGLTYSGAGDEYPVPSEKPTWWYGFDCGHAGDVMADRPSIMRDFYQPDDPYRTEWTLERAIEEVTQLAKRAANDAIRFEGAC